jgi:hypothetical protein
MVTVQNAAPTVGISAPVAGAGVQQGVVTQLLGFATDLNEGPDPGPGPLACSWTSSNAGDAGFPKSACNTTATFSSLGARTLTLAASDPQGIRSTATVTITVTAPPANLPPSLSAGALSPAPNYSGGYAWDTTLTAAAAATDPEGNTPISFTWKATSFRPKSTVAFVTELTVEGPSTATGNLSWRPDSTPSLLGDFGALGNDCYDGQTVRLTVEATDSLGNKSTRTLPDIKIFRCILI